MNWYVYHYRGKLIQSFDTEAEALAFINQQKIPSEYYREEQPCPSQNQKPSSS